jgi:hypothetical membrane protein
MAPSTVLKLARWVIAFAVILTAVSATLYPGGTLRDPSRRGYSVFQNSFSDLGRAVAWSGQANALGARLFTVAFTCFAIATAACMLGLVRIYAESPRVRRVLLVAVGVGMLSCAGLVGAALTPQDLHVALHGRFTTLALLGGVVALLLFGYATARDRRFRRGVSIGWFALAVVLLAWMVAMRWRPSTDLALAVPVTLQKVVALGVVMSLVVQSREAERAIPD